MGRKIKNHVETGNDIVPEATIIIIGFSEDYIEILDKEKQLVKGNYIDFTSKIRQEPDSWENYTMYQPVFIRDFGKIYVSQQMAQHLVFACDNLKMAQVTLYEKTRKYKKIKGPIPELTDFYVEIDYLKDLELLLEENVMPE